MIADSLPIEVINAIEAYARHTVHYGFGNADNPALLAAEKMQHIADDIREDNPVHAHSLDEIIPILIAIGNTNK